MPHQISGRKRIATKAQNVKIFSFESFPLYTMVPTFPAFLALCPVVFILQYCKLSLATSEMNFCAAKDMRRTLQEVKQGSQRSTTPTLHLNRYSGTALNGQVRTDTRLLLSLYTNNTPLKMQYAVFNSPINRQLHSATPTGNKLEALELGTQLP